MEKHFNQKRTWVYQAASALSFNGGFINGITFISFLHKPVGYVTGNMTLMSSYLFEKDTIHLLDIFLAVCAFLIGAVMSGLTIPNRSLNQNNNYNVALIIEILLILSGALGLLFQVDIAKYLLACAMGLQNAFTTFYGKSIIRTTHMTGTMTDFGLTIAQLIKGELYDKWRLNIYGCLLTGFFLGGFCGIGLFNYMGYHSLFVAVIICISMLRFNKTS
jgi:uncharacterized membrane protein YoaK (UPF0700 family)